MASPAPGQDSPTLGSVLPGARTETALQDAAPASFVAASEFWRVPLEAGHLTPRMTQLVLVAMHAIPSALNVEALTRHIERARLLGATDEDIIDVLITVVALANHALYFTVPILEEELRAAGMEEPLEPTMSSQMQSAMRDFVAARGFWNVNREKLARWMPDYFHALNGISTQSWRDGPLSPKEREFVCIAINSTVSHQYEPGLRLHIQNALGHGATAEEILQVFQLAGLLGLEGYILGARVLFGGPRRSS